MYHIRAASKRPMKITSGASADCAFALVICAIPAACVGAALGHWQWADIPLPLLAIAAMPIFLMASLVASRSVWQGAMSHIKGLWSHIRS